MNLVIQKGRLAKEPELRYTQSGKAVTNFTLAVNRPKTDNGNSSADFVPYVAWGKTGETVAKYCGKGSEIITNGHMQIRSYDNNEGKKVYITEVILDHFEFCGSKSDSKSSGFDNSNKMFGNTECVADDDIPF